MKKRLYLLLIILSCFVGINAEQVKSPQQIQQELDQAQRDFAIAQKMFIPWYTGPLITGSANNVPMGLFNVQGYLFLTDQFATYSNSRKSKNITDLYTVNPLLLVQAGITHWLDITVTGQGFFKWQGSQAAQTFGDLNVVFGLQALKQTPYVPSVRITIGENFPTGRYKNLSSSKGGIDASGSGAYSTIIGLNLNKILWWFPLHPMSLRYSMNYAIPNHKVHVKGFNAYGGGFGTNGDVAVGGTLNADFGYEISLTQKWVFATDVAYTFSNSSSFSGTQGTTSTGEAASNGGASSDQLSFAPAIEYNVSENGGFIGGVWFTATGRNSANFVSIVLSYTQLF